MKTAKINYDEAVQLRAAGKTYREIAEKYGTSSQAVQAMLKRGKGTGKVGRPVGSLTATAKLVSGSQKHKKTYYLTAPVCNFIMDMGGSEYLERLFTGFIQAKQA